MGPNTLGAARAAAAPLVDGNDADAAWASAPELALTEPAVTLRALYTATDLYVLAVVPDATASFARRAWIWDGTTWKTLQGQSEDRLAIMWNIAAPNFDRVGCLVKCHPGTHDPAGEDDAWLETGKADMWHMKAARYLPNAGISQSGALSIEATTHAVTAGTVTFSGWADDKWIGQWSAANAPDGGRYGDAGAGAETRNRSADKTAPNYVETAPLDFVDAMTLYQTEIDNGEAAQVAGLSAAQRQAAWDRYVALKAAVPERILRTPAGSRADVQQAGIWRDGTWTLEYRRALDTGRPEEDVIFNDLNAKYPFGVAWMDNTDGAEHIPSRLLSLVFLP
ncbi:MAG: hypothetical protein AUJ96_07485 [Armatimonadetes bacterium CG2_30_66_41]|nr:MAG: hypothetical protein AUJ96_07485 [Armatimonadetes bacterium CG2_30_66_41]